MMRYSWIKVDKEASMPITLTDLDYALNVAQREIDTTNARAELATLRLEHDALIAMGKQCVSLRADLQAAKERLAEQARQLAEMRELAEQLVNSLGYWMSAEEEPQECLKAELALGEWLAANPAPEAEQQP